ncbi:GTPase ObgE, partial [Staphylococcus sp. SIMBA_130]
RPQIIVANKMDLPDSEENLEVFKEKLEEDFPIYPISAVTRQGVQEVLFEIADKLETTPEFPLDEEKEEETRVMYRHEKGAPEFFVTRDSDGTFVVNGPRIEKLFKMTDFNRED